MKKGVRVGRPLYLTQSCRFCPEKWAKSPATYCKELVKGYTQHLPKLNDEKAMRTNTNKCV